MKITFCRYSWNKVSISSRLSVLVSSLFLLWAPTIDCLTASPLKQTFHISNVSNLFLKFSPITDCFLLSLNFSLREKRDTFRNYQTTRREGKVSISFYFKKIVATNQLVVYYSTNHHNTTLLFKLQALHLSKLFNKRQRSLDLRFLLSR